MMEVQLVQLPALLVKKQSSLSFLSLSPHWIRKWVPIWLVVRILNFMFPPPKIRGTLESNGVWIDDLEDMQFLWTNGFFGKGTLSRSEPSWRFAGLNPKRGTGDPKCKISLA